jgi:aryl-alcohol dehydrogenase-like predicted oxidoreductase
MADKPASLGVDRLPLVNLRRLDSGPGLRPEGDQVVGLEDQLTVMSDLRDQGKIGAIGLTSVTLDGLRRALPAGIACVQNAYSLVSRDDEDMLRLCAAEGIAWVPFFPLGGAFPGLPKAAPTFSSSSTAACPRPAPARSASGSPCPGSTRPTGRPAAAPTPGSSPGSPPTSTAPA